MLSNAIKGSMSKISNARYENTWTDGFPRCNLSGIGTSQNQVYRENRSSQAEHEFEDQSIHFCIDPKKETYLYGVFDGHDGSRAASFVSQRMPAELSFEQLENQTSGEEVKEIFRQAFLSVENAFLESIDPKIAERTQYLEKIPDGLTQAETIELYPDTFRRLQNLEEDIRGGTTAVVALVHQGILYVGNVGDSRALLCQKDKSGVLRVKQLTTDHNTESHDELERLSNLSLPIEKVKGAKFGNHNITRCIGNYFLKGGYTEFDLLSSATAEPVICEPRITSTSIDESCSFLLLMSVGLFKSYEEATGSVHVNKDIATMVVEQFIEQPNLMDAAQTVVDKIVRLHHNKFLAQKSAVNFRDDITLLIRNFHFPMSFQSPAFQMQANFEAQFRSKDTISSTSSDDVTLCNGTDASDLPLFMGPPKSGFSSNDLSAWTGEFGSPSHCHTSNSTSSTESSKLSNPSLTQLTLDDQGCIKPYVCFEEYSQKIDEAIASGLIPKSQIHLYK